jgi:hypothetical protein
LLLLRQPDPLVAASIERKALIRHFLAGIAKFLACQLIDYPHLSLALGVAYNSWGNPLRVPIPRDAHDQLTELLDFQRYYVLDHEFMHIRFATATEQERQEEFDDVRRHIQFIKTLHGQAHEYAQANHGRSDQSKHFWSVENDVYEARLKHFADNMEDSFDKRIAEEIACDTLALRTVVLDWCAANHVSFNLEDERCAQAIERACSAASAINNFRLVLETLRNFWQVLAQLHQTNGWSQSLIEKALNIALSNIQEIFLRGAVGLEVAYFGLMASALGQTTPNLNHPRFVAHLNKSRRRRQTGQGVEGFDERFTMAWFELKKEAQILVHSEMVQGIFDSVQLSIADRSIEEARNEAQEIIGWPITSHRSST